MLFLSFFTHTTFSITGHHLHHRSPPHNCQSPPPVQSHHHTAHSTSKIIMEKNKKERGKVEESFYGDLDAGVGRWVVGRVRVGESVAEERELGMRED
ncbi:hypothetical protein QL285_050908 [Trifolium repens]|nr:hypothetical protein QL285_068508 [Trifolium repens]KAK2401304.1 hypothetical protein QL285_050908 [Trifolium repens]